MLQLKEVWFVGVAYFKFGRSPIGLFQSLSLGVELHLQLVHSTSLHLEYLHFLYMYINIVDGLYIRTVATESENV